jgi:acyl-CoA hydrolase
MPPARRRFLVALPVLALIGCAREAKHAELPRGARVLALGDSLTYGTGASSATSWPAVLAQRTGWQVENAGVPGATASQICTRLPDLLAEGRPALVLVVAGGNDFLRRMPESGVREALASCIAHAQAAAVPLVLIQVPRLGLAGIANAPVYAEIAKSRQVPLIDAGLADILGKPAMRADAVHPNTAGYRAMAERIADGLAALGYLR